MCVIDSSKLTPMAPGPTRSGSDAPNAADFNATAFLGEIVEVCWATRDAEAMMKSLNQLGIGPWQIHTFSPDNITLPTYHGRPSTFRLKVCFASLPSSTKLVIEIIQPYEEGYGAGPNIFSDWLNKLNKRNGESGIHHIAFDCNDIPWEARVEGFKKMGAEYVQGGLCAHGCRFGWFEIPPASDLGAGGKVQSENESSGTYFETIEWRKEWKEQEAEAWYPFKPTA